MKHDGRHKARLVADGHLTDMPLDSVYSGVVSLRGLRIVAFLTELNDLELMGYRCRKRIPRESLKKRSILLEALNSVITLTM